ncbi:MAG TPA: ferredoxin [Acidimicrobiales bacterium]|jgi:ferredoxin|nr:ferredoxin [Acidimicrobiales bacterium]
MKLEWNKSRCVGHGQCCANAPELWEPDEDGYAVLRVAGVVPSELEDKARSSARSCPEYAITVIE